MKSHTRILMAVVLLVTLLVPLPGRAASQAALEGPVAVEAAGRGNPWLNLRDGVALPAAYDGAMATVQVLEGGLAQPLSLAAADFDGDGVPDLVAGYAGPGGGGLLTLYRGNVDSIYPPGPEAFTGAAFLTPARVFEVPAAPNFLGAGDFDNDGHPDVVLAARNEARLILLPGDGQGGFGQAQGLPLPGGVTALLAGEVNRRDGLADLAVGIDGPDGAGVLIFQGPQGALLSAPQAVAAPTAFTGLVIGALDDSPGLDLAAAAGNELLIVPGDDDPEGGGPPPGLVRHSLPYTVIDLAVGDFLLDEGVPRQELALLSGDGAIRLLDPLTATQVGTLDAPRPGPGARIVRARVSSLPADDLLLLDPAAGQLHVLFADPARDTGEPGHQVVTLAAAGAPVAALPMRLNPDALSDLVLLQAGADGRVVVETAPMATYVVGTALELSNAIVAANNSPGADQIEFSAAGINICHRQPPGSVPPIVCHIPPAIIDALTIVGGSGGAPRTALDGTLLDEFTELPNPGLHVAASDTAVRNLVIHHFTSYGLHCHNPYGTQNVIVEGNYLGTDATGAAAPGNGPFDGLLVESGLGYTVGGTAEQARNIVAGHEGGAGIAVVSSGTEAWPILIQGNYLGVGADGRTALGNKWGLEVAGSAGAGVSTVVGGTAAGAGNVISANGEHGIYLWGAAGLVQGNRIGSGDPGEGAGQGNGQHGIYLEGVSGNTVGGTAAGAGNLIAGTGGAGVCVQGSASANTIRGNVLYGNGGLGIDLVAGDVADGPTPNDPGDEDGGPNNLQNWPEIHAAAIQGDQIQVTFRVDSRPGWAARYPLEIDFYGAEGSAPYLQGKSYLGAVSYLEGEAQTLVTRTFTMQPPVPLRQGELAVTAPDLIVATATDADGNTSEFSWPVSPQPVVVNSAGDGYDPDLGDDVCWTGGYTGSGVKECTLRAAIETANARAGFDAITFDLPGGGVPTVRPQSALPPLQEAVLLDGASQAGGKVELDGSGAGAGVDGLYLDSNGSSVRGLVVNRFGGHGIVVAGDGNALLSNIVGTDAAGAVQAANGGSGIYLNNGAGNLIGGVGSGNLVSGNGGHGVELRYANTTGNRLLGNTIGLDASGMTKLGNTKSGVFLDSAAHGNMVGGISSNGEGNVISGNGQNGIELAGSAANQVLGNTIGPQAGGATDATGNGLNGVLIDDGGDNVVGGATAGSGNFISGNGGNGVRIWGGVLAQGNRVEGNQIGGPVGSAYLFAGNGADGLFIYKARDTRVAGNVVTRNRGWGVAIHGSGTTGSQLQGNLVGTDQGGNPLPNGQGGVLVDEASDTLVGGATAPARNVISGNGGAGVKIAGAAARRNTVQGNLIGLKPNEFATLANQGDGVLLAAVENGVAGNVIAGNSGSGVWISNPPGYLDDELKGNEVWGNQIGAPGMGNAGHGVYIGDGSGNLIGGDTLDRRNFIADNGGSGVYFEFGSDNRVQGNVISAHLDGSGYGIYLGSAAGGNEILGNDITDNVSAMDDRGRNVVVGNVIQGALPSNLWCTGCKSQIAGNRFGPNGGIVVSITGAPAVHKNNLDVSSTGLSKQSPYPDPPPLTASAQDNWWGEPDGPGGEGPGSGAPVSLYVDYAPWRTAPITLPAVPGHDTLYGSPNAAAGQARPAYAGGVVTNRLFFQNWAHPTDTLAVTLQDTRGWLVSPASFTLTMTDGLGASALVSVVVPAGTPLGTTDLVTVTAVSQADPVLVDTATFQVVSALVADVAVVKQGRGQATPGRPFVYDLTVTNAGPDAANGVVLTDTLPLTLTFLSAHASQGSCGEEDGLVVCQLGTLADGGQATVVITVVPAASGEVVNVVEVSADEPDPARYNNVAVEYTRVSHRIYLPLVGKVAR